MYEIDAKGKCLEIGGGSNAIIHPNMDVRDIPGVDIVWDISRFPWPITNEDFDCVISLYCIEHIAWPFFDAFIKEIHRILKSGGKAIFLTSNLEAQCKRIIREGVNYKTVECLFGTIDYKENSHKMGFSEISAHEIFKDFSCMTIAPMPAVVFKGQMIYPGSETDMIIELTKPRWDNKSGSDIRAYGEAQSGLYSGVKDYRKECLNLGSFTVQIPSSYDENWVNIDIIGDQRTNAIPGCLFVQADLRRGIPASDNSKDSINMSHLLEHFTVPEGIQLLKECLRVLRPGGIIRVCVPNTRMLARAYLDDVGHKNMDQFDHIQPEEYKPCSQSEKFFRMITSGPPEQIATQYWEGHKTAYDEESLRHVLSEAGFINKQVVEFDKRYDTFPEVALCMTGEKLKKPDVDASIRVTENNRW